MTIFENFEANERQEEVVGGKTKLVIRNDFSPFPLPPSPLAKSIQIVFVENQAATVSLTASFI